MVSEGWREATRDGQAESSVPYQLWTEQEIQPWSDGAARKTQEVKRLEKCQNN